MIHEVDDAIRRIVRDRILPGTDIDVTFDAPTKEWAARRSVPTVNIFLYDIREDLKKRRQDLLNEYNDAGRIIARHAAPRHLRLSYLVTAWTQRTEDEHRVLANLIAGLLPHSVLPAELLTGTLAELALPVTSTVAMPPAEDRSLADVWNALGNQLKPSLDLVISAPVPSGVSWPAGPPVEVGLQLVTDGDEPKFDRPSRLRRAKRESRSTIGRANQ
jgi:hypothetical protein